MDHKNDCPIYHGGQCQTPVACASQPESLGAAGVQPVTVKPPADVPMSAFYMSLRDYFAAAAVPSIVAEYLRRNKETGLQDASALGGAGHDAFIVADAMLRNR